MTLTDKLNELRDISSKASPDKRVCGGNRPFYVDVRKPAPSLSKHDDTRPTYWRYEDGVFHVTFNPTTVTALLDIIEKQRETLEKMYGALPSYMATEPCLRTLADAALNFNPFDLGEEK